MSVLTATHSYDQAAVQAQVDSKKRIFAPGSDPTTNQAKQFSVGTLERSDLLSDPYEQFHKWFDEATAEIPQAEGCTLSTAELPSGKVSARIVYLKELDGRGFVVYSNWLTSRKAHDIESNPYASLTFWWREQEKQIRIEGATERLTTEESQVYYDKRIRGSKVGAWASEQSKVLQGREELEKRVDDMAKKFEGQERIPVPDFWGGLRVVPEMIEFWQGRDSRLHDRFRFLADKDEEGGWKIERLAP